jgi:hypothetical protein
MSIFAGKPPVSDAYNGQSTRYVLVEWEEGKSTPDRQAGAP